MRDKRVIEKYLRCHSEESGRWNVSSLPRYESAVVVPAYDEDPRFLQSLLSEIENGPRRLVVAVVNHPESASETKRASSARLLSALFHDGGHALSENAVLYSNFRGRDDGLDLIALDATEGELRLLGKDGVGRARKIGADLCVALYARGRIRSRFLGSTDADAILPSSYFDVLEGDFPSATGLLFPYHHKPSQDVVLNAAMKWVEAGFRYYVLGLAWAGSPYAYPSLGSALSVSLPHYAQVRGVPNRQAGEDFYLLSKLSKLGPLYCVGGPPVCLETRRSERVPFGTGPSSSRAAEVLANGGFVETYNPSVFESLRVFLRRMEDEARAFPDVAPCEPHPTWVLKRIAHTRQQLEKGWRACPTLAHRLRHFHEQFDALATLRFVHEAEKQGAARLGFEEALGSFSAITREADKSVESTLLTAEKALLPEVGIGERIVKRWPEESLQSK